MNLSFEPILTDYQQFAGVSAAQLGYDPTALDQTFYDYRAPKTGQHVGVYVTEPHRIEGGESRSDQSIIMPASHNNRLEPLWTRRMDIMASRMGLRVIGVETPGTTGLMQIDDDGTAEAYALTDHIPGTRPMLQQALGALAGNFAHHTAVQLDAIMAVTNLDANNTVILFGESMGAAIATDMLDQADARGLHISDLVLYEMVNSFSGYRASSPLRLNRVLPTIENDRSIQYSAENEAIGHPMEPFDRGTEEQIALSAARKSLRQQGIAAYLNGIGMARGKQAKLANLARHQMSSLPKITLARGRDSLAALPADYVNLADALSESGMDVSLYEMTDAEHKQAIGHSHLISLGRQACVADWLKTALVEQKN